MSGPVSPLASPFPEIPPIAGVRIAVTRAGYKAWERTDLTYAAFEPGTAVAGVKGSLGWLTNLYGSLGSAVASDLTSRWITLSLSAILLSAVVASIAAVVIFADE